MAKRASEQSQAVDFSRKPGKYLLMATLATVGVTIIMPWTPLNTLFGFRPLPLSFILVLGAIVVFYFSAIENVKGVFYSRVQFELSRRSSYDFGQLRNVTVMF